MSLKNNNNNNSQEAKSVPVCALHKRSTFVRGVAHHNSCPKYDYLLRDPKKRNNDTSDCDLLK